MQRIFVEPVAYKFLSMDQGINICTYVAITELKRFDILDNHFTSKFQVVSVAYFIDTLHFSKKHHSHMGVPRIFERWFLIVMDLRCRGLGAQPPVTDKLLIFKIWFFINFLIILAECYT